jgi:hypothetical protein
VQGVLGVVFESQPRDRLSWQCHCFYLAEICCLTKKCYETKLILMQIKYRHHTGYYNINFNLDRILMLLRKASCIARHSTIVMFYITLLYTQCVSITRAIIRYHHKNKQRKVICRYITITCMKNEISFFHIKSIFYIIVNFLNIINLNYLLLYWS